MKKYIALAALLAAGTAFANAEKTQVTLKTDGSNENPGKLVADENGIGSLTESNGELVWDGGATLTSWQLDFTLTVNRDGLADADLLDLTDGNGPRFAINSNGTFEWYYGGISSTNSERKWESFSDENDEINLSISYVADYDTEGTGLGTGTLSVTTGERTILSLNFASGDASTLASGDVRIWTNSAKEHYRNITLYKLDNNVIPEPSAFGLLAGLGALALVASRRRRR